MAISNYLCNKCLKSTAYIELNSTGEIINLSNGKKDLFKKYNIHIFANVTLPKLQEILSMKYTYFVIDFGIINSYTVSEYIRCDKKVMLCSTMPWKINQLDKIINLQSKNYINLIDECCFLKTCGNKGKKEKIKISSGREIIVYPIPFLENPFQISNMSFTFFNHLLERI